MSLQRQQPRRRSILWVKFVVIATAALNTGKMMVSAFMAASKPAFRRQLAASSASKISHFRRGIENGGGYCGGFNKCRRSQSTAATTPLCMSSRSRGYVRTDDLTFDDDTAAPRRRGGKGRNRKSSEDYSRPVVQWYPGHIAKAERQLQDVLKAVDVVVEVRDARAPLATSHPKVPQWCAGRPRLVVLTHVDMVPAASQSLWKMEYLHQAMQQELGEDFAISDRQVQNQARQAIQERLKYSNNATTTSSSLSPVDSVLFVNAQLGSGIPALKRAIFQAGAHVQERRQRRGLLPRPLRVGIMGFPNVGKSALINRLLGRRRARTANTPGVTRSLQWIRVRTEQTVASTAEINRNAINKEFELLDSPGIIPTLIGNQEHAELLAACNCIGQAAYDNQAIASKLFEWLFDIHQQGPNVAQKYIPEWHDKVKERYKFNVEDEMTGDDFLFRVADATCRGDPEDAARKILQDFRTGRMGPICLQVAPNAAVNKRQLQEEREAELAAQQAALEEQQERARAAIATAQDRGLELPPIVQQHDDKNSDDTSQVGKGLFDGW